MSDPDPHSSHPRRVSAWRWLLVFTPSVLLLSIIRVMEWLEAPESIEIVLWFLYAFTIALCFAFGFLVEKWLRGRINSVLWALICGFMVLIGNVLIVLPATFLVELR